MKRFYRAPHLGATRAFFAAHPVPHPGRLPIAAALFLCAAAHAQMDTLIPLEPRNSAVQFSGSRPYIDKGFQAFRKPQPLTIETLHERAVAWFVGRPGFGFSRVAPVNPVKPIEFDTLPFPNEGVNHLGETLGVAGMQLIGIARHDPPVAFIIENRSDPSPHRTDNSKAETLPMENLRSYKTRPLAADEEKAITALKADPGRQIVTTGPGLSLPPSSLEVVGAIRATTSCLECHRASEGDLLGAFSYKLKALPVPQAPAEQPTRIKPL